jgi:hypothetical protein
MDSPPFLHIQHHSTRITFLFRKLSNVQIFLKVAIHAKNTTLEGALTFQIIFQRKGKLIGVDNT